MSFDFPKLENKILKFWKEKKIFEKSLEKTRKGRRFVFYEGPPFANGLPGIHHLLARAFKDIILRYKTMQGFYVERRAGWDTHGLPTEMEAEKKLNIKSKKEIEKLGIEKFIEECKNNVFTYKKEWEEFTERIGFWLDFKNAYITCDNDYIETLWWILKQIWQRGLLYQDYKVVPYCPRCGTSLSSHEVAQGYQTIKENSIYIKFKVKKQESTCFLVWTTTPWTLPGNAAVAVNPKLDYVKVKTTSGFLFLAKGRTKVLDGKFEIVEEFKGEKLLGLEYEPLYDFQKSDKKAFYMIAADFVSLEEGTGLVHIAPAFGEEDMEVGKKNDLPVLMTVDEGGKFRQEVKNWAGMFVKDADPLIVEDLKKRKLLFREEMYEHEYPFCWRCETPLLYYAKNSWFIRMTGIKKELIENSQEINWEPEYIKKGRFGEWLKEVKDWNLSRERYWGTPLPIWQCDKCKKQICIGSLEELKKFHLIAEQLQGAKRLVRASSFRFQDLHRPFIDEITFKCEKCGGTMRRVPEVVDCWFDSGSMPFSQWHYPFEDKDKIDKGEFFPADFIAEGIDQTRGWFYTLLAVSTLLGRGVSYRNVICLGLVLDAKGQKMSKSRGNVIKPKEVIDKFGADCARFYFYTVNPAAEPKRFNFKDVQTLYRKFFDILWQSYTFFETYVSKKEFPISKGWWVGGVQFPKSKNILDRWIVSRLESLNYQVIENLEKYNVVLAARIILDFLNDLSNWYIRCSRKRFRGLENKEAFQTLYYLLLKISKLIAPFTPFIAEELYQKLAGSEDSVHLESFPKPEEKLIDKKLEEKMKEVREIITQALALRAKAGIKVRQPLASLEIKNQKSKIKNNKELLDLIKEEVNVKKINFGKKIKLDTKITKELKKEGELREIIRNIKELRKKLGLTPEVIVSKISSTISVERVNKDFLKEVGAKEFKKVDNVKEMDVDIKKEIKLGKEKHYIGIKK